MKEDRRVMSKLIQWFVFAGSVISLVVFVSVNMAKVEIQERRITIIENEILDMGHDIKTNTLTGQKVEISLEGLRKDIQYIIIMMEKTRDE